MPVKAYIVTDHREENTSTQECHLLVAASLLSFLHRIAHTYFHPRVDKRITTLIPNFYIFFILERAQALLRGVACTIAALNKRQKQDINRGINSLFADIWLVKMKENTFHFCFF